MEEQTALCHLAASCWKRLFEKGDLFFCVFFGFEAFCCKDGTREIKKGSGLSPKPLLFLEPTSRLELETPSLPWTKHCIYKVLPLLGFIDIIPYSY